MHNFYFSIGHLPENGTQTFYSINGPDNIGSELNISKNINDFEVDFKLKNQHVLKLNNFDKAFIELLRKF